MADDCEGVADRQRLRNAEGWPRPLCAQLPVKLSVRAPRSRRSAAGVYRSGTHRFRENSFVRLANHGDVGSSACEEVRMPCARGPRRISSVVMTNDEPVYTSP